MAAGRFPGDLTRFSPSPAISREKSSFPGGDTASKKQAVSFRPASFPSASRSFPVSTSPISR